VLATEFESAAQSFICATTTSKMTAHSFMREPKTAQIAEAFMREPKTAQIAEAFMREPKAAQIAEAFMHEPKAAKDCFSPSIRASSREGSTGLYLYPEFANGGKEQALLHVQHGISKM
jgi:hypothetical protein